MEKPPNYKITITLWWEEIAIFCGSEENLLKLIIKELIENILWKKLEINFKSEKGPTSEIKRNSNVISIKDWKKIPEISEILLSVWIILEIEKPEIWENKKCPVIPINNKKWWKVLDFKIKQVSEKWKIIPITINKK